MASEKAIETLEAHTGVVSGSEFAVCVGQIYTAGQDFYESPAVLDVTVAVDYDEETRDDALLVAYRRCGKTGCSRECQAIINPQGEVVSFAPSFGDCAIDPI